MKTTIAQQENVYEKKLRLRKMCEFLLAGRSHSSYIKPSEVRTLSFVSGFSYAYVRNFIREEQRQRQKLQILRRSCV